MPGILNEITFFQFDNLIRNRIPFLILNLGVDLKNFYSLPLYQGHLESQTLSTSLETVIADLKNRKALADDALLVLCADGRVSGQVVDQLEANGYTNVFFAKNGFVQLKADATH